MPSMIDKNKKAIILIANKTVPIIKLTKPCE